jgi:hypothetical protein
MSKELVNHNPDLQKLVAKGYAIAFDSNYIVVRDIPYLNHDLASPEIGAIVTKFVDVDGKRVVQDDHQIFFAGSHPHGLDGKPIPNLGGGPTTLTLSDSCRDVVVQRSFSNKPKDAGKFEDFFAKIESYVTIISGPAIAKFKSSPFTFREVESGASDSPFKVRDTLTSRAEIGDLAARFKDDVIAIIGLGGTGAYVLDFIAKTPVCEIRGFDPDRLYVHNTFRSPGRLQSEELGKPKAEVYQARYENFRSGVSLRKIFIDASSADDLKGVTFAFVCVDKGTSRGGIFDVLISMKIPFIDVGMGLEREQHALNGMLRSTYFSADTGAQVRAQRLADTVADPEGLYKTVIQISELNALNAALAVAKFKQVRGFYVGDPSVYHVLLGISDFKAHSNAKTGSD